MRGYYVSSGYFGLVSENYILFATENEYYEYLKERENHDES